MSKLSRSILAIGLSAIVIGGVIVASGERGNQREDLVFVTEQESLRNALKIFPEGSQEQQVDPATPMLLDPIGILQAPTIGLDVVVVDYEQLSDLNVAVGRMHFSAVPGAPGMSIIIGHRTGFGSPFLDLDQLRIGDQMQFVQPSGVPLFYKVTAVDIVLPSDGIDQYTKRTDISQLVLVTCHPKYSTDERLIIVAEFDPSATTAA